MAECQAGNVRIMNGEIYTCYFAGLGGRSGHAVSLTLQQPPKFNLPVARELCPPFGIRKSPVME